MESAVSDRSLVSRETEADLSLQSPGIVLPAKDVTTMLVIGMVGKTSK